MSAPEMPQLRKILETYLDDYNDEASGNLINFKNMNVLEYFILFR